MRQTSRIELVPHPHWPTFWTCAHPHVSHLNQTKAETQFHACADGSLKGKRQTKCRNGRVTPLFTLSSSCLRALTVSCHRHSHHRVAAMIEQSENRRYIFVHRQGEEHDNLEGIIITLMGILTPNLERLQWVREWEAPTPDLLSLIFTAQIDKMVKMLYISTYMQRDICGGYMVLLFVHLFISVNFESWEFMRGWSLFCKNKFPAESTSSSCPE